MKRTPEETLRRVLKVSRLNGWSVAIFAAFCVLVALVFVNPEGIFVSTIVLASGAMEVWGNRMLHRRKADGMKWLIRAQFLLLGVIAVYAVESAASFDADGFQQRVQEVRKIVTSFDINLDDVLRQYGIDPAKVGIFAQKLNWLIYGSVMLTTLLYQGGLALFYRHRIEAVEAAIRAPPMVAAALVAPEFPAAEQRFYDQVAAEMAGQNLQPGLWARALAEAGANDARAQAFYIRLRVAQLRQEENDHPS